MPTTTPPPRALVAVVGPQASGKSTVSRALVEELRRRGELVALVELDQIAAMALPTLPSWETAHRIFASVAGQWARAGLSCVVAEGIGSQEELTDLLAHVPDTTATITVAVTAPCDLALARAQADVTRGISRDPDFLRRVYQRWSITLSQLPHDVLLDTSEVSLAQGVDLVRAAIESARTPRALPG